MKKTLSVFLIVSLLLNTFTPFVSYAEYTESENNAINLFSNILGTFADDGYEVWVEYTEWCYKWVTTENRWIKITEYLCTDTNINIPEKINWYTVKEIWENAFKEKHIQTVTFPNSIEVIWTWTFKSNIFEGNFTINFPSNLKIIYANAFESSWISWNIQLPNKLEYIWDYAFSNFYGIQWKYNHITDLIIPDNVKYVWEYAFNSNPIQNIKIWKNVEYIWDYSFQSAHDNTKSTFNFLSIPDSVIYLWMGAFQWNKSLETLLIWSWNWEITIRAAAFNSCNIKTLNINKEKIILSDLNKNGTTYRWENTNPYENITITANKREYAHSTWLRLVSTNWTNYRTSLILSWEAFSWKLLKIWDNIYTIQNVSLPEGVTEIENSSFQYRTELTNINIPNTVTKIWEYAFSSTYKLSNIKLPEWLKEIWTWAFAYSEIPEITIPDSVEFIWDNAFYRTCKSMKDENWVSICPVQKITVYITKDIAPEVKYPESVEYIRLYRIDFTWDTNLFKYPERERIISWEKAIEPDIWIEWHTIKRIERWEGKEYDFTRQVTKDIVLESVITKNKYNIKYTNAENIENKEVLFNEAIPKTTPSNRTWFIFKWREWIPENWLMPAHDITLTWIWEKFNPTPSAWGWSTLTPSRQETKTSAQEHNSADTIIESNTAIENTSTNTANQSSNSVEEKIQTISPKSLTRWELAVFSNILLDIFPKLTENKKNINEYCTEYTDYNEFSRKEQKAISKLCRLAIMWIHEDDKTPLETFWVHDLSTNEEFIKVVNRMTDKFSDDELKDLKSALSSLEENKEDNLVFWTVVDVFKKVKELFN